MSKTNYTFASIVPLIGGESIGMSNALGGTLPDWVASFPVFAGHDDHYLTHLKSKGWDGEYAVLEDAFNSPKLESTTSVDIVSAVCPCAGLSSFSAKPDASKNDYMMKSAQYVLEHIKPRVFWGENAPRLASKAGTSVRDQLVEIARKHGYSCTFYKTAAWKHGVAQKRPRTFYFMWKSPTAPLLRDHIRDNVGLLQQISGPVDPDDPHQHQFLNPNTPSDDPWMKWAMHETGLDYAGLAATNPISLIEKAGKWNPDHQPWENYLRMHEWLKENDGDERWIRRTLAMSEKLKSGEGGLWTHGITLIAPDGVAPAFIGVQPTGLCHPVEDRFLNMRESMRMMGLPEDFRLNNWKKNFNHICQNVHAGIAEDMAHDVIAYLNGELPDSGADYVIQENGKIGQAETPREKSEVVDLEEFYA